MMFKIIDRKTGKEPTERVIRNIAKKGGLMEMDIDGFYVGEDGQIILVDDCGRVTWCDMSRFKAESEDNGFCVYHGIECDYKGGCINCPHNTVEDIEWFKQDEERAESEEEA